MELSEKQIEVLIGVHERKPITDIASNIDVSYKTAYRILQGLNEPPEHMLKKWRTEKKYVRKLGTQNMRNNFVLTVEGLRVIEQFTEIGMGEIEGRRARDRRNPDSECKFCFFDDKDVLHVHHIIPRSQGGDDSEENTITLCANCHAKVHRLILRGCDPVEALNKVAGDRIKRMEGSMNDAEN